MGAPARVLPALLLGLLLGSTPGAPGANPGLVARITDQGLQYGKARWLWAGLADPLGTRLLWVRGAQTGRSSSGRVAFRPGGPGWNSGLITQPLSRSGTSLS